MKDLIKNTFPIDGKKLSLEGVSEKIYIKWFVITRKSVSTTRNEAFVKSTFPLYGKAASSGKEIKNGFH